ncbi:hypothetical protein BDN71DRAFT_1369145, partial [Pleurotus eryngii]
INLACQAVIGAMTDMNQATEDIPDFVPPIWVSSLQQQYFKQVPEALHNKNLQLLYDVETQSSSTLLMIDHALLLHEAIDRFLMKSDFAELQQHQLSTSEWEALKAFKCVLQVPHTFQQHLSGEKTPTLCDAIPAFKAMMRVWKSLQNE